MHALANTGRLPRTCAAQERCHLRSSSCILDEPRRCDLATDTYWYVLITVSAAILAVWLQPMILSKLDFTFQLAGVVGRTLYHIWLALAAKALLMPDTLYNNDPGPYAVQECPEQTQSRIAYSSTRQTALVPEQRRWSRKGT